jgi:hypothetical protein
VTWITLAIVQRKRLIFPLAAARKLALRKSSFGIYSASAGTTLHRQQLQPGLETVYSDIDFDAPIFEPLVPVELSFQKGGWQWSSVNAYIVCNCCLTISCSDTRSCSSSQDALQKREMTNQSRDQTHAPLVFVSPAQFC